MNTAEICNALPVHPITTTVLRGVVSAFLSFTAARAMGNLLAAMVIDTGPSNKPGGHQMAFWIYKNVRLFRGKRLTL